MADASNPALSLTSDTRSSKVASSGKNLETEHDEAIHKRVTAHTVYFMVVKKDFTTQR